MGTRLTKYCRHKILSELYTEAKEGRLRQLRADEDAVARDCIKQVFGDDAFAKFDAVPDGWLLTERQFYVRSGTGVFGIHLCLSESRAMPKLLARASITVTDDLYDRAQKLTQQRATADEELLKLDRQIRAALASFTTFEKLKEGWPEAYAKLPAEQQPVACLPAVPIASINEMIAKMKGNA